MLKRLCVIVVMVVTGTSGIAQKTAERGVGDFNRIEARGALKIVFRQSDTTGVRVIAESKDQAKIVTEVEEGTLRISGKGEIDEATIELSAKELRGLDAQGAISFSTDNEVRSDVIELSFSGASTGHLLLGVSKLQCVQTGASVLTLKGKADVLTANISGASTLKAFDLETKSVEVESSGASNVKVTATERFKGQASGASSIRLKGEPADVTAESSSAASIIRVKEKNGKSASDTLTYNWNNKKVIIVDKEKKDDEERKRQKAASPSKFKHWRGISLGVNGYVTPSGAMDMPSSLSYMDLNYARSFNIQINPIERHFYIVRHNIKLVTGIGFDLRRYELANRTTLTHDSSFTHGFIDSVGTALYDKNKLRVTYLQVPLLLEFNTSNNYKKTFHFAVGVIGQYRIGSSTKQIIDADGFDIKRVNRDDYNLSPFGLKAHVNFGYRGWTIFAEYNLTPLFMTQKGPELYPAAAGLRVIPFI